MTQKELLYLEDAIKHEDIMVNMCTEAVNFIEDEDLVSYMDNEAGKHMCMKEKLINFMEELINE
jgi:hypothetical protein